MLSAPANMPLPATVVVSRRARPGCEQQLQDWSRRLCRQAEMHPGHLRSRVFRQPVDDEGELVLGITFSSPETLATWNVSPARVQQLAAVVDLTQGAAQPLSVDDLTPEQWILAPSGAPPSGLQPRWVSALIVWLALYPCALFIGWVLAPVLDAQPLPLRTLLTSALLVPVVLFVGVPAVQRLLGPLLHRRWS